MSRPKVRRWFLNVSLACITASTLAAMGQPSAVAAADKSATLSVGAATVSITPAKPAPLLGQMHLRVSQSVESPVTAAALALETRQGDQVVDQVIFVVCDLGVLRGGVIDKVREHAKDRVPDFDLRKLVVSATHTHSAPTMIRPGYDLPKDGVIQPEEYVELLVDRLTEVIVEAWSSRKPGLVGWGLGHAVVGQNRRAVYADGHAQMYGKTDGTEFRSLEGYEDHGVEVLFFWNQDQKLIATAVNVACPAQEAEHNLAISADYWHEVRELLRARHGDDLVVLGWIGAAGDQTPRQMIRKEAEERMRKLRGLTRLEELARRIDRGWEEAYEYACEEKHGQVALSHVASTIQLPPREVTAKEYAEAKAQVEKHAKSPGSQGQMGWHQGVVNRFEQQKAVPSEPYPMELHVVRLGDVAIATNSFELFTDYGIQIKARSPALQTFVIQLAGEGTYVPTERAVRGGGYSAIVQSNSVGPKGGQVLVERTVEAIRTLWSK